MSNGTTHMELLNPPQEVSDALSALIHACGVWSPTEVANHRPFEPPASPHVSTEAQTCYILTHPDYLSNHMISSAETGAFFAVVLILILWMMGIFRLPGHLYRIVCRLISRARSAA